VKSGQLVRAAAAMFLLGPAAIHFAVAPEHLRAYLPYGLLFIALALFQVSLAAAVVLRPSPVLLLGGAGVSLLVIAIWLVSRTAGLPIGPTPGIPEPIGLPDLLSTLMEWIAVILLLIADARLDRRRPLHLVRTTVGLAPAAAVSLLLTLAAIGAVGSPAGH
jgi:hypothetical protein